MRCIPLGNARAEVRYGLSLAVNNLGYIGNPVLFDYSKFLSAADCSNLPGHGDSVLCIVLLF